MAIFLKPKPLTLSLSALHVHVCAHVCSYASTIGIFIRIMDDYFSSSQTIQAHLPTQLMLWTQHFCCHFSLSSTWQLTVNILTGKSLSEKSYNVVDDAWHTDLLTDNAEIRPVVHCLHFYLGHNERDRTSIHYLWPVPAYHHQGHGGLQPMALGERRGHL